MEAHYSEQVQRKQRTWQSKVSHLSATTSIQWQVTSGCLCNGWPCESIVPWTRTIQSYVKLIFFWWNHQDLSFQRNHWLRLHNKWRTKVCPWPQRGIFCWKSQAPPSPPDNHFCQSELQEYHQELCYHNLFPQWFYIYMALAPAWTPNTTSLFYLGTNWDCYTLLNHILP